MAEKREPSGMYGETPRVQIGEYSISKQGEGSIWIETDSGEGAAFQEDLFEAHIHAFFAKFF